MDFEDYFNDICKFTEKNSNKIKELGKGQHPEITVISCSDSRLSFPITKKLGKVFTIREMGGILNDSSIASIEYSTLIGVKKLLFMGHTNCGAIKGALELVSDKETEEKKEILKSKFLRTFMHENIIKPLNLANKSDKEKEVNKVVEENSMLQIKKLLNESEMIRKKFENKEIDIEVCQYCTETGAIEFKRKFKN